MKKMFGIALIFSSALVLSACSGNQGMDAGAVQDAVSQKAGDLKDEAGAVVTKSSRDGCISSCNTMWKSNKSNEGKSESAMATDCSSLCDAGQGIQNQDIESCAKAEGVLRDTCYGDIAKNTSNPKLCEKIESGMLNSACYIAIVEKTGDKSLCEKITVKMMKDSCMDK